MIPKLPRPFRIEQMRNSLLRGPQLPQYSGHISRLPILEVLLVRVQPILEVSQYCTFTLNSFPPFVQKHNRMRNIDGNPNSLDP